MLNNFEFSKKLRIKDSVSYRQVIQENKRFFTKHLIVYYRAHQVEYSRMGVIVSKKVSKRAVVRNRVKRTTREWFRLNQHQIKALSLVVIAKKSAAKAQNVELQTCLNEVIKKLAVEFQRLLLV